MIRRKTDNRMTFTKRAVKALLIIGVINAEIPYILALFGKETVEGVALAWITEIVAVITGYMCKAYFETKQERRQNHDDFRIEAQYKSEVDDEQ